MAQAKTLTDKELKKVLNFISCHPHAARNRAMLLVTHWSGMRVGSVAALRIGDVLAEDGTIRAEVRLTADQVKGGRAYTEVAPCSWTDFRFF
jgi:integrase/recombinase XerD